MYNITGKNIKKIREQKGLTQKQLAIRLEIEGWKADRFVISKIERGKRQITDIELFLIAEVLDTDISMFYDFG